MPHTVRRPVWVSNPAPRAQNVRKVGAVKQGRNTTSMPISDGGSVGLGPRSIGALEA